MAIKAPLYKNSRTTQKSVSIYVDQSMADFLRKKGNLMDDKFMRSVEKGMKKGMVAGVSAIKSEMGSMRAVATGFMRKTVSAEIIAHKLGRTPEIVGMFGTKAWYDILVHEGLGYHSSGGGKVPAKYQPTAEQLAIVEPDAKTRRQYYKKSPRIPRPFLKIGLKKALPSVVEAIRKGIEEGIGVGKAGRPSIDMRTVMGGGRIYG